MRRFYAVNIASALVWAPSHILPGVLVGATFGALGAASKPLAILSIILLAAGWVIWRLLRWTMRRAAPLLNVGIAEMRTWAATRDTSLSRSIASLLDPERSERGSSP
ncbi:hypothetical protein ACOJBO_12775 [Rhizobium beringeri]